MNNELREWAEIAGISIGTADGGPYPTLKQLAQFAALAASKPEPSTDIHSCHPNCARPECVAEREGSKPEPQAQAGEPGNNKGKSNGRNDKQGPALGANLPLGGSPDASVACSTYSSLSSLTDVLWNSDEMMELNADLGLTMDQLIRVVRVSLSATNRLAADKPAAGGVDKK